MLAALKVLLAVALVGAGLPAGAQTRIGGINAGPEAFTAASAPASPGSAWQIYDVAPELAADALLAARVGGETSQIPLRTPKQLQAKFKHASDFGVTGNYSKAKAAEFSSAIHQHINSPNVRAIQGTYRKNPVTHYLDPWTGLNVMADPAGNFISGWKLSPGQLQNVLTHGGL